MKTHTVLKRFNEILMNAGTESVRPLASAVILHLTSRQLLSPWSESIKLCWFRYAENYHEYLVLATGGGVYEYVAVTFSATELPVADLKTFFEKAAAGNTGNGSTSQPDWSDVYMARIEFDVAPVFASLPAVFASYLADQSTAKAMLLELFVGSIELVLDKTPVQFVTDAKVPTTVKQCLLCFDDAAKLVFRGPMGDFVRELRLPASSSSGIFSLEITSDYLVNCSFEPDFEVEKPLLPEGFCQSVAGYLGITGLMLMVFGMFLMPIFLFGSEKSLTDNLLEKTIGAGLFSGFGLLMAAVAGLPVNPAFRGKLKRWLLAPWVFVKGFIAGVTVNMLCASLAFLMSGLHEAVGIWFCINAIFVASALMVFLDTMIEWRYPTAFANK